MSEPEQNPRIEASKRKVSDALELHQHVRAMIGLNPFNILQRMKSGVSNFKAQQAQQAQPQQVQASGNPTSNPTMGAQVSNTITPQPRTRFLNLGFLQRPPPPQAPPPPTEEQKAEIEKQRKLEELEDKKKRAREKRYRLDHLRGLSVDRT